jgi:hypothetical protein
MSALAVFGPQSAYADPCIRVVQVETSTGKFTSIHDATAGNEAGDVTVTRFDENGKATEDPAAVIMTRVDLLPGHIMDALMVHIHLPDALKLADLLCSVQVNGRLCGGEWDGAMSPGRIIFCPFHAAVPAKQVTWIVRHHAGFTVWLQLVLEGLWNAP